MASLRGSVGLEFDLNGIARALDFPGVYQIVRGQRAISAGVALGLGKYFGMTPHCWMNLHSDTICGAQLLQMHA